MNRLCFKGRPIASIKALACALHVSPRQLCWAIGRADTLYRPLKPITKSDGSVRQTYDPAAPLKDIQRRINRNIFSRVEFPIYLQGGIRDRNNPRHCIANAKLHSGVTIVINEDITSFFPSITSQQVRDVWQNLFHFPPEIAEALTILTTLVTTDAKCPQNTGLRCPPDQAGASLCCVQTQGGPHAQPRGLAHDTRDAREGVLSA